MNTALRRFLLTHGNITTEGSPKSGICPTLFERLQWFFIVHSIICKTTHRRSFEQFGALFMHTLDAKHPTQPGFVPMNGPIVPPRPAKFCLKMLKLEIFHKNDEFVTKFRFNDYQYICNGVQYLFQSRVV